MTLRQLQRIPGIRRERGERSGGFVAKALLMSGLAATALLGSAMPMRAQPPAGEASSGSAALGEALAPSNAGQLSLGEHLRQSGFLFYGAWWCPACFRQKSLFGEQAGRALPYVECDRSDEGRQRCDAAGIRAYPTWVRGNERREGVQSLEELGRWSGWKPARP